MATKLNASVLMSGADYFDDAAAINPYMTANLAIDHTAVQAEHHAIKQCLESAGINVIQVPPPAGCQDGVYTANWAVIRNKKAIMSVLPNARKQEEAYAEKVLQSIGLETIHVPDGLKFSGQGDNLSCGNYLFAGSGYRSDQAAHRFVADTLGYQVVSLQTVPLRDTGGQTVINKASGWPDSLFYDIDLALSVIDEDLIAWCPQAFASESQDIIAKLPLRKIEVDYREASESFACNLVSTGQIVIMSNRAPKLQAAIESLGYTTVTPHITELRKGGGYIRCIALTLSNT